MFIRNTFFQTDCRFSCYYTMKDTFIFYIQCTKIHCSGKKIIIDVENVVNLQNFYVSYILQKYIQNVYSNFLY